MKEFNVLYYNHTLQKVEPYNIIPYFHRCWNDKSQYSQTQRSKVVNKESLREWILKNSMYEYWARCEYEFLIAPWPISSNKVSKDLDQLITKNFNIHDYKQNIDFWNIIIQDFYKIDIHEQIAMNITIITEILAAEFNIK